MTPTRRTLMVGLLAAAGAAWLPSAAGAQDGDAPIVDGRSFAPIPFGQAFAVETDDDSEENLGLCDAVRLELVVRRRPVAPDGPLRVRVSADHVAAVALERADESNDRVEQPGEHLPMIRDDLGTSLPERTMTPLPTQERRAGPLQYRLQAVVEERATGRVLWQGEARGVPEVGKLDERRLGKELAAALVSRLVRAIAPAS